MEKRRIKTIPIAEVSIGRREIDAVKEVLESGRLRAGSVTEQFEEQFAAATAARHAVAVSSGTAALFLACRALLRPGDEVIVPDFTFVATAAMAAAAGTKPVLADVDPATCNLDPAGIERRITSRTRALIPVHLYGHPAAIDKITRIARRHNLRLIWDAAQAHGAEFGGRDVGSFPDAACYSFYPTKNMTTGEGGMITTSDSSLARELKLLRSHGEESRYRHVRLGYNFRTTDIASAIGLVQLSKLPQNLRARKRNAAKLARGLTGVPGLEVPSAIDSSGHAFSLFTVVVDSAHAGLSRDDLAQALAKRNIQTAVHYPVPLHRQPIFRRLGRDRDFPVSTRLAKSVLSLPVHPSLTRIDLDRIVNSVREIFKA